MNRVTIQFQSPDFNDRRNPGASAWDEGVTVEALGFDLDFSSLTIYPIADGKMDYNHTLAVRAPYMNEDGYECGDIGWQILPEPKLLEKMPELRDYVNKRYGRVIVTPSKHSSSGWPKPFPVKKGA